MFGKRADARDLRQPMAHGACHGVPAVAPGCPHGYPTAPPQMGMGAAAAGVPAYAQGGQGHMTGMQHLGMLHAIDVQEKANILQEVTAALGVEIQMANRYHVLDRAGNRLFHAVERTDCCKRQMQNSCCHDCASWEVDVFYTPQYALQQTFIKLRRPCQLSCCCFKRPTAEVIDQTTNRKLGSFRDPCTCCSLLFHIRDIEDREVLRVNGGCCCCQPGFWCPLPCGPCSEVSFNVEDVQSGQRVATISKQVPGLLSWCFAPDVDNYKVDFEQVQAPQWKALLVALTIFMDFRYFNTNRNEEEARNRAWGDNS